MQIYKSFAGAAAYLAAPKDPDGHTLRPLMMVEAELRERFAMADDAFTFEVLPDEQALWIYPGTVTWTRLKNELRTITREVTERLADRRVHVWVSTHRTHVLTVAVHEGSA